MELPRQLHCPYTYQKTQDSKVLCYLLIKILRNQEIDVYSWFEEKYHFEFRVECPALDSTHPLHTGITKSELLDIGKDFELQCPFYDFTLSRDLGLAIHKLIVDYVVVEPEQYGMCGCVYQFLTCMENELAKVETEADRILDLALQSKEISRSRPVGKMV